MTELGPRVRHIYWLLLLLAFSLPGVVAVSDGAAQPVDSSVPQELTDAPVVERVSRGAYPKLWSPEPQQ